MVLTFFNHWKKKEKKNKSLGYVKIIGNSNLSVKREHFIKTQPCAVIYLTQIVHGCSRLLQAELSG